VHFTVLLSRFSSVRFARSLHTTFIMRSVSLLRTACILFSTTRIEEYFRSQEVGKDRGMYDVSSIAGNSTD
jgi:hypothetical protein